ncbi:MAG: glutamate racemase [Eubacteriales bacterium]|nr:glutamate racemase [Eubacteriales bacterium]
MNPKSKAIGVFDSGLGGLSAVKKITQIMPNEDIVYFGDTGRVPYGTRSEQTIIKYATQDVAFLMEHNIKMIIIACGTVSTVAYPFLEKSCKLPLVGITGASVKGAIKATKTKHVAIMGTNGTIGSGVFQKMLEDKGVKSLGIPCPLLIPLVENDYIDRPATRLIVEDYLKPVMDSDIDTIILGCTHFPLLSNVISDIMGPEVTLINSGAQTAQAAYDVLKRENLLNDNGGKHSFYVSDDPDGFGRLAGIFLGNELTGKVEKIDIENY